MLPKGIQPKPRNRQVVGGPPSGGILGVQQKERPMGGPPSRLPPNGGIGLGEPGGAFGARGAGGGGGQLMPPPGPDPGPMMGMNQIQGGPGGPGPSIQVNPETDQDRMANISGVDAMPPMAGLGDVIAAGVPPPSGPPMMEPPMGGGAVPPMIPGLPPRFQQMYRNQLARGNDNPQGLKDRFAAFKQRAAAKKPPVRHQGGGPRPDQVKPGAGR